MSRRYVVVGAGAIGGGIAGRLAGAGQDVVAVARGEHGLVMSARGLRLVTPDDVVVQRLTVVEAVGELAVGSDDVVILAVKSQHTAGVLDELAAVVRGEPIVACAQNGVANERAVLRHYERVIAICVMMPATYLVPGEIELASNPVNGVLELGWAGRDGGAGAGELAAVLRSTGRFESAVRPDIARWKYGKLLSNLGNAVEAARLPSELRAAAMAEGRAVYAAAGIDAASDDEMRALGARFEARPIAGRPRPGGSSWQSVARGAGSIEADFLNGEIALLGRLHGVPTPVNEQLQRAANALVAR